MRIGILVTGPAPPALVPEYGTYFDMFARFLDGYGFSFTGWTVHAGERPSSIHEADGWLISGSRHGVYEDHAFIPPLEAFIREVHAARLPLIGICFGHQIIARAMGARVEKFDGGWRAGLTDYAMPWGPWRLNAYHQDQVLTVPKGAEVVGHAPGCAIAALRYGSHAFSLQPHPEFDNTFFKGLIDTRGRGVVPDAILDDAETRIAAPNDNAQVAAYIADFFRAAQEQAA